MDADVLAALDFEELYRCFSEALEVRDLLRQCPRNGEVTASLRDVEILLVGYATELQRRADLTETVADALLARWSHA
jgi:hypothetical protein